MKKHFLRTLFFFTLLSFLSINTFAVNSVNKIDKQKLDESLLPGEETYSTETVEAFLDLTPKKIKEKTGKRLKLKEVIALKAAQKRIKKAYAKGQEGGSPKSQLVALLLAIFVGGIGIHRFYLGYIGIGIIQIVTLGGCGIWALIDLIRIAMGDLKPADGSEYDPTL